VRRCIGSAAGRQEQAGQPLVDAFTSR
jgi:hypothetical protein